MQGSICVQYFPSQENIFNSHLIQLRLPIWLFGALSWLSPRGWYLPSDTIVYLFHCLSIRPSVNSDSTACIGVNSRDGMTPPHLGLYFSASGFPTSGENLQSRLGMRHQRSLQVEYVSLLATKRLGRDSSRTFIAPFLDLSLCVYWGSCQSREVRSRRTSNVSFDQSVFHSYRNLHLYELLFRTFIQALFKKAAPATSMDLLRWWCQSQFPLYAKLVSHRVNSKPFSKQTMMTSVVFFYQSWL